MRINRLLVGVMGIVFVMVAGCGSDSDTTAQEPKGRFPDVVTAGKLQTVSQSEVVDRKGRVWIVLGPTPKSDHEVMMEEQAPVDSGEMKPLPTDPYELAELLRPIMFRDGMMYKARDLDIDGAKKVIAGQTSHTPRPPSDGWGPQPERPDGVQIETSLETKDTPGGD